MSGSTMRMASRMRVTPSAVVSPVSTGWENDGCTNDCAARVEISLGRCPRGTLVIDATSSRAAARARSRVAVSRVEEGHTDPGERGASGRGGLYKGEPWELVEGP